MMKKFLKTRETYCPCRSRWAKLIILTQDRKDEKRYLGYCPVCENEIIEVVPIEMVKQ
jgi:hypothetical protein